MQNFILPIFYDTWDTIIKKETKKIYFQQLITFLNNEYKKETIYPDKEDIFNVFKLTPFANVKVVIIGQDPYHQPGYAHGLSFSVKKGIKIPSSLKNIFKEYQTDLKYPEPKCGNLESWSKQGVLLLNSTLTVREGKAGSHHNKGWDIFTNNIIEILSREKNKLVFILWGKQAEKKASYINKNEHLIITSPHPSPLSAHKGFFQSKPFSKTNQWLKENNKDIVNWKL